MNGASFGPAAPLPPPSCRADTMSMPLPTRRFTAADVRGFPDDGNRYEVVHRDLLVTPSPGGRHQLIVGRLAFALQSYLLPAGREELLCAPADISWDDETLVQPDLFVGDFARFHQTFAWSDIRTLHRVIEVLSPASRRHDRGAKRRLYQEQRIPQYWIVDGNARTVEVWTPDADRATVERGALRWRHPDLRRDCVIDLASLFRGL